MKKSPGIITFITTVLLLTSGTAILFFPYASTADSASLIAHRPLTLEQRAVRADYWARKLGRQFGVPATAYQRTTSRLLESRLSLGASSFSWTALGPMPMNGIYPNFAGFFTGPPLNSAAGRVAAVAADPTVQGLVYVGAAGGGVWRSTDSGNTFTPVFDSEPTQAIGALTVDSRGDVWVGTGEGVHSDSYYGQGLFKSTDHGGSWTRITGPNNAFVLGAFRRIAVDDNNPPHLFAALTWADSLGRAVPRWPETNRANNGLWRSTDGGASWTQVGNSMTTIGLPTFNSCSDADGNPCPADDVVFDPHNPNRVYADINSVNVFTSTDGGFTWAEANFPGIATGTTGQTQRSAIAVTSAGAGLPATVYAAVGEASGKYFAGFFASTDSGATWAARTIPQVTLSGTTIDGDGTAVTPYGQADYDLTLSVAPGNPQTVYFGGVGPYVSTDGGASWSFIAGSTSNTTVQTTHCDQQASAVDPFNPAKLYIGNDGGFYMYDLAGRNFTTFDDNNQNDTIDSGQIQTVGPHPTNDSVLLAGFQDNGTQLLNGTTWNSVDTGDGGFALFDSDPTFAYHTFATLSAGPEIAVSTDGGLSWRDSPTSSLSKVIVSGDTFNFYPPLAAVPGTARRVMIGGHYLYVSTDGMTTWTQQSGQNLAGSCALGDSDCALQDIAFVPTSPNLAWALSMTNTGTGTGFALNNTRQADLNSGAAWSAVTANLPFSSSQTQATGISVDPTPGHSEVAYLSISGFTAATGVGHIFKTTDFGATWTEADGAGGPAPLPDVPTLRVLVDSTDATGNTLLAGTDIGIFRSTDDGATWTNFNLSQIPAVPIFDLQQNRNGTIFAGTHGRGAYRLNAPPTPTPTASATPTARPTATSPLPTGTPQPTSIPSATPSLQPTAVPSGTPTPGAIATSAPVSASATAGATVSGGSFTVSNTTGSPETISSVTVDVSDPALFARMTLSAGSQSAVVSPVAANSTFVFSPSLPVPAGGSVTFTLSAVLTQSLAAGTSLHFAFLTPLPLQGHAIQGGLIPLSGVLLMIGLALTAAPAPRRRRIAMAATLLVAACVTVAGCASSGGSGRSNPSVLGSSTQTVSMIAVQNAGGGTVGVSGIPVSLGTIKLVS